MFQLGLENQEREKPIIFANTYVKKDGKWGEIKSKIILDPNLNQEKVDQLWQLLGQFQDVFAWHKGELGCCSIGEHYVDT